MEENQNRIAELLNKINQLSNRHDSLKEEIDGLKRAIYQISQGEAPSEKVEQAFPKITNPQSVVVHEITESSKPTPLKEKINLPPFIPAKKAVPTGSQENRKWEEFIGTNLLNKVGIAILVLGISFGVKYAIDHQMLNPLTRIILGYLAGASIIAFALKLKKNYEAFSAVLLGGCSILHHVCCLQFVWLYSASCGLCINGCLYRLHCFCCHELQPASDCCYWFGWRICRAVYVKRWLQSCSDFV
jgi:uncharacterized membrane protein